MSITIKSPQLNRPPEHIEVHKNEINLDDQITKQEEELSSLIPGTAPYNAKMDIIEFLRVKQETENPDKDTAHSLGQSALR